MSMNEQENKRVLHGNQARITKGEKRILPQSYRADSTPQQYGFESLPGSPEDLKNARTEYKTQAAEE